MNAFRGIPIEQILESVSDQSQWPIVTIDRLKLSLCANYCVGHLPFVHAQCTIAWHANAKSMQSVFVFAHFAWIICLVNANAASNRCNYWWRERRKESVWDFVTQFDRNIETILTCECVCVCVRSCISWLSMRRNHLYLF